MCPIRRYCLLEGVHSHRIVSFLKIMGTFQMSFESPRGPVKGRLFVESPDYPKVGTETIKLCTKGYNGLSRSVSRLSNTDVKGFSLCVLKTSIRTGLNQCTVLVLLFLIYKYSRWVQIVPNRSETCK